MAYSADTFVADEQPTTAKWNKLWSNDASFNDGTGIADDAIITRHLLADNVTDAELIYGKVRKRQGGSATVWQTAGTNNYNYDSTNVFIQVGAANVGSGTTITFPTAFTYAPAIFVSVNSAASQNVFCRITGASTTQCILTCITDGGAAATGELVCWMAIGE